MPLPCPCRVRETCGGSLLRSYETSSPVWLLAPASSCRPSPCISLFSIISKRAWQRLRNNHPCPGGFCCIRSLGATAMRWRPSSNGSVPAHHTGRRAAIAECLLRWRTALRLNGGRCRPVWEEGGRCPSRTSERREHAHEVREALRADEDRQAGASQPLCDGADGTSGPRRLRGRLEPARHRLLHPPCPGRRRPHYHRRHLL